MRVKDYERSNTIHRDDVFLIDGPNGTKTVIPEQLIPYSLESEAWADGTMDGVPVTSQHPAYHNNAKYHSDNAAAKALVASNSAGIAEQQANLATTEASAAGDSADDAAASADEAATYAEIAQAASEGGLIPQGNIAFADLPAVADAHVGDFYVITDDFVSTSDFREGAGISHEGGTAVYLTSGLKWEVYVGRMNDAMPIIAPVEPSPITHAYEIGEKFIHNNILYQATRNISVGDTITPGTNCEEATSLVDQIDNCAANDNYRGWKADFYAKPLEEQMRYNTFDFFDDDDEEPGEAPFITRSEAKDAEVIEGKNLFNNTKVSEIINGVTFTVNPDKTVRVVRTETTTSMATFVMQHRLADMRYNLPDGQYIASGCNTGEGSDCRLRINATNKSDGTLLWDHIITSSGVEFTVDNSNVNGIGVFIQVDAGSTPIDTIICPMICTPEEYSKDPRYEPYYIPVKDAMLRRSEQRVLGAKNLLENKNSSSSVVVNGITFTKNSDDSITANGTATATARYEIQGTNQTDHNLFNGKTFILSGCPKNGSSNTYFIECYHTEPEIWNRDVGDGVEFTVPTTEPKSLNFSIYIKGGTTVSNLTFYPMLRLASDPDDTFVPYAMTNRELTDVDRTVISSIASNNNYSKGPLKCWYKKIGKLVELFMQIKCDTGSDSWVGLINYPNIPKPAFYSDGSMYVDIASAGAVKMPLQITFDSSGLKAKKGEANNYYHIHETYISE